MTFHEHVDEGGAEGGVDLEEETSLVTAVAPTIAEVISAAVAKARVVAGAATAVAEASAITIAVAATAIAVASAMPVTTVMAKAFTCDECPDHAASALTRVLMRARSKVVST